MSPGTISNCFRKAGFDKASDVDEPVADIDCGLELLQPLVASFLEKTNEPAIDVSEFAFIDNEAVVFEIETDSEIVRSIAAEESSDDDEDEAEVEVERVSHENVFTAIGVVRQYLQQQTEISFEYFNHLNDIENLVERRKQAAKIQPPITKYFNM